ncbi:MAG: RNA polymerase sigma factor [Pyrinomonadaceae bacterium]
MGDDDFQKEETVAATAQYLRPVPVPEPPPEALENLFREHYDRIYRAAYRVTGSSMDAEDVLQTVFMRLSRRTEPIDLQPNPTAYLLRAALNAGLDIVRGRSRSRTVSFEDDEARNQDFASTTPAAQHEDAELRRLIQQAVAKLSPKTAEMFALRYYEGYGNIEIAEMLGTSQLVVGVMLHRSRTRLRKEIGQYLEKHHDA